MHRAAATAAVLAVLAGSASADKQDLREGAYLALSIDENFDSNVMNSRGADAVTRLTPRVGVVVSEERGTFGAEYRAGLHAYLTGTADETLNHRAAAGGQWRVTRRFTANGRVLVVYAEDPIFLERPAVTLPHGTVFDATTQLGASWRASRRTTLSAAYAFRLSRFELARDPAAMVFDGDEQRFDLGFARRLTRRLDVEVAARGYWFVTYGADESGAVGGTAGLAYRLTPRWRLRGHLGPILFVDEGATLIGDFAAIHDGRRTRFLITALREIYGGTGEARAIWSDSLGLGFVRRFGRRYHFSLNAGAYRTGTAPTGESTASGLYGGGLLGWDLGRNLSLDAYAEHRAQDTAGGLAFDDVMRTVVGVRLTAAVGVDVGVLEDMP